MTMVKVPEEIRELFTEARIIPLGTSSLYGVPNTIFIGSWWWRDEETLLVVDNFFDKTIRNLEENPVASLVAWNREKRLSYQLKCSATIRKEGEDFQNAFKIERNRKDFFYPCKSVVLLRVEEVYDAMFGESAGRRVL